MYFNGRADDIHNWIAIKQGISGFQWSFGRNTIMFAKGIQSGFGIGQEAQSEIVWKNFDKFGKFWKGDRFSNWNSSVWKFDHHFIYHSIGWGHLRFIPQVRENFRE